MVFNLLEGCSCLKHRSANFQFRVHFIILFATIAIVKSIVDKKIYFDRKLKKKFELLLCYGKHSLNSLIVAIRTSTIPSLSMRYKSYWTFNKKSIVLTTKQNNVDSINTFSSDENIIKGNKLFKAQLAKVQLYLKRFCPAWTSQQPWAHKTDSANIPHWCWTACIQQSNWLKSILNIDCK